MRALLLCLLLLPGLVPAAETDSERDRLTAQRRAIEQRFAADQAACELRFAVTACIEAARLRRRDELVALQHRESALQRSERAAEVERRRQASAGRAVPTPAARAASTSAAREPAAAASSASPARQPVPRTAPAVADRRPQEARARAAYERRQREAAEHRRNVEARQAAQAASGSRSSAPLPAPAASPAQR